MARPFSNRQRRPRVLDPHEDSDWPRLVQPLWEFRLPLHYRHDSRLTPRCAGGIGERGQALDGDAVRELQASIRERYLAEELTWPYGRHRERPVRAQRQIDQGMSSQRVDELGEVETIDASPSGTGGDRLDGLAGCDCVQRGVGGRADVQYQGPGMGGDVFAEEAEGSNGRAARHVGRLVGHCHVRGSDDESPELAVSADPDEGFAISFTELD